MVVAVRGDEDGHRAELQPQLTVTARVRWPQLTVTVRVRLRGAHVLRRR
jgi:hypothetical protein